MEGSPLSFTMNIVESLRRAVAEGSLKIANMKPLLILLSLVALSFCMYAGYRLFRKCEKILSGYETMINSSQSLLAGQRRPFDVRRPLKVVCLGNSITRHGYLPAVEWYSDWGMAASREENDYCHLLQGRLRQYNGESSVTPLNIACFERNPACDIDSLLGDVCRGADIIVIRLGENVQDDQSFGDNIQRLIDRCKACTPHVLVSGCFWLNGRVEKVLVNAALDNKLKFIPLYWIGRMRDAYPRRGDAIYDTAGERYVVTKEFILTHPNDEGMASIANALFDAITCLEL